MIGPYTIDGHTLSPTMSPSGLKDCWPLIMAAVLFPIFIAGTMLVAFLWICGRLAGFFTDGTNPDPDMDGDVDFDDVVVASGDLARSNRFFIIVITAIVAYFFNYQPACRLPVALMGLAILAAQDTVG